MKPTARKFILTLSLFALPAAMIIAQDSSNDSLKKMKYLPGITVIGRNSKTEIHQMPEIAGTSIYAGKKNSLIVMDNVKGNVVTNNMRQVMAKVPGIHIWESDGSGIQIGIAARGLSPNRSWEFNVRQNGYDIAADPYGYPEAYYNPQLQAVQRIEVVRGQGSLQYGPQFGGLVNYILRDGSEINKPFQFETQQTVGSNGLFNTYNAVGGETKRSSYYAFVDHRNADGWRQNSRYYTNSAFGTYTFKFSDKFSLSAELMHSAIRSQQPGGLTDEQFNSGDLKQSFRSRNWFDIKWTTLAFIAKYEINDHSRLNVKVFSMLGNRNSVGYIKAINIKDTINAATLSYNNRTLDIDQYRNSGMEARYLSDFKIGKMTSTFSGGIRLYTGSTHRFKDGVADNSSDYTGGIIAGTKWPRDITYKSFNAAVFAENVFRFNKLLIIPGIRYELVEGKANGRNGYNADGSEMLLQNQQRSRSFVLAGIGAEYHVTSKTELYGNITQAYRPIQFADLTAPPTTDIIDPDLTDAKGYNVDFGYRGKVKSYLFFDVSAFYLRYDNRVGTITQQNNAGAFYNYRTNVGSSNSNGVEALAEFSFINAFATKTPNTDLSVFASYSYTNAKYDNLKVVTKVGNDLVESNLKNKKVENAPTNILRTGITYMLKGFSITGQLSYVGETYSDANNTVVPTANAQTGLIPSYKVTDITVVYKWNKNYNVKAGINNITDEKYFTRRGGGYPGPGLLPADGRTFFVSFGAIF
ncbi:MAG TPA: TonB-dependent receptor [Ferruginibacter sp.]|nr:TonB-dependent receptor [Ferruginibacter sp.]HPH92770.1 TonB-dependent receptor [Ferruginibacter sp.]